jgi:hypothetical protein
MLHRGEDGEYYTEPDDPFAVDAEEIADLVREGLLDPTTLAPTKEGMALLATVPPPIYAGDPPPRVESTPRMTYEQAMKAAIRKFGVYGGRVHSLTPEPSGAWTVTLYGPDEKPQVLPDGDSGIPAERAWDDPRWRAQQVIPAGLERPCWRCAPLGTMRVIPGSDHFDADGTGAVAVVCDYHNCRAESGATWWWPTGLAPAEDPSYSDD